MLAITKKKISFDHFISKTFMANKYFFNLMENNFKIALLQIFWELLLIFTKKKKRLKE